MVMTFVDKDTHKQLKLLSIEKERNMEDLFTESLLLYLEMHNRKPIALTIAAVVPSTQKATCLFFAHLINSKNPVWVALL